MRRRFVRAVLVVLALGVIELSLAQLLARQDPIAGLLAMRASTVAMLAGLYATRLFLFFAAPPWLAVRLVKLLGSLRPGSAGGQHPPSSDG